MMVSTRARMVAVILTCLTLMTPVSQRADERMRDGGPNRLYKVTVRDEKSGGERTGFIDNAGRLVIGFDRLPRRTKAVGEFQESRAVIYVAKEGVTEPARFDDYLAGYIDETGKVVVAPRYQVATDFSEGLAFVASDEFRGFIDPDGKPVLRTDYGAGSFHEGLASASPSDDRGFEWGYIDRGGRWVIKGNYRFADDFSEGLAGVALNGKYGFINRRGEMVIQPRFGLQRERRHPDNIVSSGRFKEGLACVSVGRLYGYIDKKGEFVSPPQFSAAADFSEGLAWAVLKDGKQQGWIDKTGRWVITQARGKGLTADFSAHQHVQDVRVWSFSEGLAPFLILKGGRGLWGYLNRAGKVVIEPREFSAVGPFRSGLARVSFYEKSDSKPGESYGYVEKGGQSMEEKYGYIDRTGRFVWRAK